MLKISCSKVILIALIVLVISAIILMAISVTPKTTGQKIVLSSIRDCIWYGFDEKGILPETSGEKEKIVLAQSLVEYTPLVIHYNLEEVDEYYDGCELIYNPQGYEDKTWIVIYNSDDFKTRLFGNYVLWSNKEIQRKKGVLKDLNRYNNLKYYCIPD